MRKAFLWFRWVIEGILGVFLLMGCLADVTKIPASIHEGIPAFLGSVVGTFLMGYFGYWLLNNAINLYKRLTQLPLQ